MPRTASSFALALLLLAPFAGTAFAMPDGWTVRAEHTRLAFPTTLRMAPDGRLFYLERATGRVMVYPTPDAPVAAVWATLPVESSTEHGMLGLAFHPQYPDSPYVYVYYTNLSPRVNRVVRMLDMRDHGVNLQVIVDDLPAYGMYHHGGRMAFGPDGLLYVTFGDETDPQFAPESNDVRGKILRFTPLGQPAPGNPFGAGNPVYATGVRNPFGLTFDPLFGLGYFTDNGPDCDDKIELLVPGADYGWGVNAPCGTTPPGAREALAMFTPTIAPTGCTIYRSTLDPTFDGDLFFGSFNLCAVVRTHFQPWNQRVVDAVDRSFALTGGDPVTDVTMGADGTLWFCSTAAIWHVLPPVETAVPVGPAPAAFRAEPNPFRGAIGFALPRGARGARLEIVDVAGRRVRSWAPPLPAAITWDGCDPAGHPLAAGVYFARLIGGDGTLQRRLVRLER
jgi:glucose/arabinose dehydrogenase